MRSLTSVALMLLGLFLMFGLGGCSDDPLTVAELEDLLAEAAVCDPGEFPRCVVVDTYCCPRAINQKREREVRRALADTDADPGICLAECIAFSENDSATCVRVEDEFRCRIEFD